MLVLKIIAGIAILISAYVYGVKFVNFIRISNSNKFKKSKFTFSHSHNADTVYKLNTKNDKSNIIDGGNHIKVSNASDEALLKALEIARTKYGSTLDITGDDTFRSKVINLIHKHKLDIKFTNKDMNKTLTNLQQPFIIKILKKIGKWTINKIISIVSILFWIAVAIALLSLIVIAVLFIAKQIYEYFGLGWAITFIIVSFFIGLIMSPNNGNTATGGRGYSGRSSGDNGGDNSGYAPYQGDKSMVGGVVGGSATPPVGGRAGQ